MTQCFVSIIPNTTVNGAMLPTVKQPHQFYVYTRKLSSVPNQGFSFALVLFEELLLKCFLVLHYTSVNLVTILQRKAQNIFEGKISQCYKS